MGWAQMGRRRADGVVQFPEGVQRVVNRRGRPYFYWAPKRNTKDAGKRVPLGSDPTDPEFWRKLRAARGQSGVGAGTFDALILAYKESPEWLRLRPRSRKDYAGYLDKLSITAGEKLVCDLSRLDAYHLRDAMSGTPVAANYML